MAILSTDITRNSSEISKVSRGAKKPVAEVDSGAKECDIDADWRIREEVMPHAAAKDKLS